MYYLSLKLYFPLVLTLIAFGFSLLTYSLFQQLPFLVTAISLMSIGLGIFFAKRLYMGLCHMIHDSQHVSTIDPSIDHVPLTNFFPYELNDVTKKIHQLAKTNRENVYLLSQLNVKSEKSITEGSKSLARHNIELAILNRFITPITPPYETANVIKGCLEEFHELTSIHVKVSLSPNPIRLLAHSSEKIDLLKREASSDCKHVAPYLLPICSKKLIFGYLVVDETSLDEGNCHFLETFAHSAGIIMQNEILLRTNQEKHAVLKGVIESMYDAITWFDNKGKMIYANQRLIKLLDMPEQKLRGVPEDFLFDLIANLWSEHNPDTLDSIRKNHGCHRFKIRRKDGEELFLMVSVFPVITDMGAILGKGYIFRDITKEQEVDKLKNDLISLVSHEFKTPITSIKGNVETLLRKDAMWDEEFKTELLLGIHEDIGRIQVLVNDWLDLSKIEAGAISLNREPIRPFMVVYNAITKMPKHFGNGINIQNDVPKDLPLLYADRLRLEQVVANLLTNAIRYNDRSPHIKITATSDDCYVHIAFEDNGIGIRDVDLTKVFERLSTIDGGGRRCGGTGLGLAICKGIMQAHGGNIQAESTKDIGSIFTISIPKYRYSLGGDGDYEKI